MSQVAIGNGVALEHQISGDGDPVLLVMGTGGSLGLWAPVLPGLADGHRVIAYDHRGMGGSTPSDDAVTIRSLGDDAAALLEALDIERAHVIGWSLGSAVSQELAINHADRVASLTLYATWGRMDGFMRAMTTAHRVAWVHGTMEEAMTALGLVFSPQALDSPDLEAMMEQFAPMFPQNESQVRMTVSQMEADIAHDTLDRLGQIGAPTLVLAGEQDVITPPWLGEAVAAGIPDARFELLEGPGSSHGSHLERTEDWLSSVLEHLARHAL